MQNKQRFYKITQKIYIQIHKVIYILSLYTMLISTLYAQNTTTQNTTQKLIGIPKDDRKIHIAQHDLYILPYFDIQVGIGATHTYKIAEQNNAIINSGMPTFMLGIGFQQQYYIAGYNFGYKLQLAYEVGVKTLGENTMTFRSAGGFFQIHAGYKYFLPYISFGYEILSVGDTLIPSTNDTIFYKNDGIAFGGGITILLNRYHAIDIGIRNSAIYGNATRIIFAYEFRF